MMELNRQTQHSHTGLMSDIRASNDNRRKSLSSGRSVFPEDAIARIFKRSRSTMTSGNARTTGWRLVFERRKAPFIEPLMGYTGSTDTLPQVELEFATLQSAIRYAERQGLTYIVEHPASKAAVPSKRRTYARSDRPSHAFSDATLKRLRLTELQESYEQALNEAANRNDAPGTAAGSAPIDVVRDPTLSLEEKRSILMNWAWTEYLVDQATNEGMPENNRPSRLEEVEQAMLALERDVQLQDPQLTTEQNAA
ncbi:ETC complex I subunit [Rhizobium bangladeshense]|nr:NADH dehydrogenase ubiquinone Fe-S protein 4 [Rhizobium bangladeshense]MBX4871082.1 ETC complex I subunit [Rhizobium bangladeshense]MBX4871382.1 ETC complex I subunit [Rhizobium bangladeshense]MBX4887646.1 ETC complex I subunit [Rhizobium bangladeshense]MBX4899629.1 ETC complex I subunit [Rhizobium bangladeshense]MBX4922247.1 ETC complex I subunit [Rhizobium bangladeshense]